MRVPVCPLEPRVTLVLFPNAPLVPALLMVLIWIEPFCNEQSAVESVNTLEYQLRRGRPS